MWRPAHPRKHPLLQARWPTASEAATARWFAPLSSGRLRLARRTWVPAMVPWRATEDGFVTDDVVEWYERFARGRPGAIVVEATGIRDVKSGPLLRIGHDRFVPGLRRLVDAVKRASGGETRLFIQLIDFLKIHRRPDPATYFSRHLVVTDHHRRALAERATSDEGVRAVLAELSPGELEVLLTPREFEALRMGYRERVTDLHLDHVRDLPAVLPDLFADAAARAEVAGFDGVELHYAHAYTMSSFLSALNDRADRWGGPRENRVRLPLEVLARVRARVGEPFVVGCRYLSEDCVVGGNTVDDAAWFGARFAERGIDFLSLSRGGRFEDASQPRIGAAAYPYTGRSGWECMPTVIADEAGPFGRNIAPSALIRRRIRDEGRSTPVVACGGIATFDQAEALLEAGAADIVASARQSLADPDWFEKVRLGHGADVRRCTFTNYCEGLDQMHKQVTCKLWDRVGLDEPDVRLAAVGRRRLVAPVWRHDG